jgi:RNA polymerase sigma-70 factor (ECF subfamily)
MREKPDTALVAEARAGDREAFCELVRRYQDHAYGLAVALVSDFDLAQDVVQEAFVCAYCDLAKLRDLERFAGWLRGIVRNTARRALRDREHDRLLVERLAHLGVEAEPVRSPAEPAETIERREVVQRALQGLPRRNREAVTLYYVDGLSYADIAGFLGVTRTTVKGRLQRGRQQLREELRMVEDTFDKERLPEEFAQEIAEIIDTWAERGVDLRAEIDRLASIGAPAVEPLCKALDHPRPSVRRGAAHALCALGDERAVEALLATWRADYSGTGASVPLRRLLRVRRVLAIPGAREAFLRLLRVGNRDEQEMALHVLSQAEGDQEVLDRVREVLRTPGRLQHEALSALLEIDPDSGARAVREAVASGDTRLRAEAAWLALWHRVSLPIETCVKALGREVPARRGEMFYETAGRQSAGLLLLRHGEEGERVLRQLLARGSPDERAVAALALAEIAPDEAFEVLRQELSAGSPDHHWTKAVARALSAHCAEQLRAWLEGQGEKMAGMPGPAWVLAKSATMLSDAAVEALLREGTPSVRAAAVRLLAKAKGASALPELRRLLREGRPRKVAQEAIRRMLRLGEAAHATAREMLESEHWTERKAAVVLLRRWGKLSQSDADRAGRDPHVAVRKAA